MKAAVLVMAYGGPDSLEDIGPYLLDIRGGRPTSPELVEEIRERYARIGGRSPLLELTRAQASGLEACLNALSPARETRVFVGMRHWKPYIREAVAQIAAEGYERGLAFCMAPHASQMSSGAYLKKLREAEEQVHCPRLLEFIPNWHDRPFLIRSLAAKVHAAEQRFPEEARGQIHYLFTAHSLPASSTAQGDPYAGQLHQTVELLAGELGLPAERWTFGYQSAGAAPGQWLGPSIEEIFPQLAQNGIRDVLITPVGFMADHVEVLFDIDIEAQEIAHEQGIRLVRSDSLNASPDFIEGLAKFILERLPA
ncbi:MAG TPA: ferrochelatase [Anaerolineaceae bacterium]|nr:ferrochelatase [Anaerolineaceae bacterium]